MAATKAFLFFSAPAPAPHVTGFVIQLRHIQVGQSVDERKLSDFVVQKQSKNMERF